MTQPNGTNLPTVCVLCSHNCGLRVDVVDGRIVEVRADESNPITKGYICNKAFEIDHYVEHGDRVRHPMRRRPDGTFEEVDWDTAISEIAAKLVDVRTRHSPRAIALVGIGGQGNHMDAPYAMAFLRGTGSRRWFNAFAQEKTQHNLLDQWMFEASPATFLHADTEHAKFLLVLGTNPKISNRGHAATETFKKLAADRTRTVVVADPRETETTRTATRHLRVGRAPTPTSSSAWRRSSCAKASSTRRSSPRARSASRRSRRSWPPSTSRRWRRAAASRARRSRRRPAASPPPSRRPSSTTWASSRRRSRRSSPT
jgi:anaerobic selenocysteine-containing dehydrogenase